MSARFQVDLLRPGRAAYSWKDWFLGPPGLRRLIAIGVAGAVALVVVLAGGVLPAQWRLSADLAALPQLRRDLATSQNELNVLRANLRALSLEARRHVRWGDLLTAFSNQMPAALRLQKVEAVRAAPPAGAGQAAAPSPGSLRIEALTPLRPGSPPLVDAARFMAGLMRDPALSRRYELKSWEIRPAATSAAVDGAPQLLLISVTLGEKPL